MNLAYYGFMDKRARQEYGKDGEPVSYNPDGIVVSINYDMPSNEKLDYLVLYCSPRGAKYRESRGSSEIEISEIPKETWDSMKKALESTKFE